MKKLCFTLLALSMPFLSIAGEAKVTWKDFNDYRDVYPGNEVKGAYHKRVAKQFEKHIYHNHFPPAIHHAAQSTDGTRT